MKRQSDSLCHARRLQQQFKDVPHVVEALLAQRELLGPRCDLREDGATLQLVVQRRRISDEDVEDVRQGQLLVKVAIEALHYLLRLVGLYVQARLSESLLDVEEVHVLLSVFRGLEQFKSLILIELGAPHDQLLSGLVQLGLDIGERFDHVDEVLELVASVGRGDYLRVGVHRTRPGLLHGVLLQRHATQRQAD